MESTVNSKSKKNISVFNNIDAMADSFFDFFKDEYLKAQEEKRKYNIALSGGNTPLLIFQHLVHKRFVDLKLDNLHIYWSDERCVPPDNKDSNYGNIWNTILRYLEIPEENIHRIFGENEPIAECQRYSEIILENLPIENSLPVFDIMLLGLGEDGHTASIFPDGLDKLDTNELCYKAFHPISKQIRITFSLKLINNSRNIIFLVTGKSKSKIVKQILRKNTGELPSEFVNPGTGKLMWFLDKDAARLLRKRFLFF